MLFRECPKCSSQFDWEDWVCPNCGTVLEEYQEQKRYSLFLLFWLVVVILGLGAFGAPLAAWSLIAEKGFTDPVLLGFIAGVGIVCAGGIFTLSVFMWRTSSRKRRWMVWAKHHTRHGQDGTDE